MCSKGVAMTFQNQQKIHTFKQEKQATQTDTIPYKGSREYESCLMDIYFFST